MLSIFAIDPEICRNLEWFRYCTEHCHPSQGRVIADLPYGQWYKNAKPIFDQLVQELDLPTIKAQGLKDRLNMVRGQLVDRPGTVWTDWYYDDFSQFSWITEIEKEHRREPFSAVVSPEYEEADAERADDERRKYHPDELNRNVKAWNTPSGIAITRSPGDFVKAILPMLRIAENIHFIDRYFNVDSDSLFTRNYKKIIKDLAQQYDTTDYPFPSLTIHCCPDVPEKINENSLKQHYTHLIPIGESVKVFVWQIENNIEIKKGNHPFHNRYVLSNHCGVIVGYGTDSFKENTAAPDVLQVIGHKIYMKLWNQIRDEAFPMIHIEEATKKFVINGTKSA